MSDLTVLVPSRGRPQNIERLRQAWQDTEAEAELRVICDSDDPTLPQYPGSPCVVERKRLGPTLNEAALLVETPFVGFMGDDHLPRTKHWDRRICEALQDLGVGIAYGNDLLQREVLATAAFMTTEIVSVLGYMVPGGLVHLYIDNAWVELGRRANCLRYLPEVVIEHLHPAAGKAQWDDRYSEVNSGHQDASDKALYHAYVAHQIDSDVQKIQASR